MADVFYATENQKTTEEMNESNVFYATEKQQGTFKKGDVYPGTFDESEESNSSSEDENWFTPPSDVNPAKVLKGVTPGSKQIDKTASDYNYYTETQSNDLQSSEDMKTINILVYITIALLLIVLALSALLLFQKRKSKSTKQKTNVESTEKPAKIKIKFNLLYVFIPLIVIIVSFVSIFSVRYSKAPKTAENAAAIYLSENTGDFTSFKKVYNITSLNGVYCKVKLSGSAYEKNYNKTYTTTFSADVSINLLTNKATVKAVTFDNRKITKK